MCAITFTKIADTIYFIFRGRFGVSLKRLEGRLVKHFGGFFHEITRRKLIGRKISRLAVLYRIWRLGGFLYYLRGLELRTHFQN